MPSVGPAPGPSSGSKGDRRGRGGGDRGWYCLLCCSPDANVNSLELLKPLDPNYGIKVNSNSWVIFMLRKLLQFTPEECQDQLASRGGVMEPAQWFQICGKCVGWLHDFRTAERGMMKGLPGAEEKVNSMRRQVRDKLRTLVNTKNDDRSHDDILDFLKRGVEEEEAGQPEQCVEVEEVDDVPVPTGEASFIAAKKGRVRKTKIIFDL